MAVTLIPRPGPLHGGANVRAGFQVVVRLAVSEWVGSLRRPAVWAAVGYAAVLPILQVALLAESPDGGTGRGAWALAATICYLPLYCRLVYFAARGRRPPMGRWTLLVLAVIIIGALPLAGPSWQPMFHILVVSLLIVLPFRSAIPIAAVIVAAQAPLAIVLHSQEPAAASYYVLTVVWRSAAIFVPIWLIGAIAQLNAVRERLAYDAVVRERLNIDAGLRSTVGAALVSIVDRGHVVKAMIDSDSLAVSGELQLLVDSSRAAAADARQLIGRYHRSSLREELDVAITLLTAAGIDTKLSLPPDLPEVSDVAFRTTLRAMTARVLRDEGSGPFIVAVRRDGDGLRLDLLRGHTGAAVSP